MCWRRCVGSASTMPSSRSTAPKSRSWTAARRLRRGDRSGRHRDAVRAAPLYPGAQAGAGRQERHATANCGPHLRGFRVETEIEFDHPLIGRQTFAVDVEPDVFRRDLARARTFGFMRDVAKLWSAGYALGACFENTVVVADNRMLNPRACASPTSSSATRRSMPSATWRLPARRCIGAYHSVRGGHKLNHAVLTALMADPSAWTLRRDAGSRAPGARPCRTRAPALSAPAYGPDVS